MASASSTCTAQQHHHVHASHDVAADADFLEHMPVLELHRNNILKLETDELLKECRLDLQHTKWHKAAQRYLSELNTVLEDINRNISIKSDECPLPLDADKLPSSMTLDKAHLHVVLDKNVGITTRAGNAKDLPLLQCSIVLPNSLWKSKDYLHHRYFSKRNLIFWHVLEHLNQHGSVVGAVEWRYQSGNERFPVIVLTPPFGDKQQQASKKNKRHKQQHPQTNNYLPKKAKFQVEVSLKMESSDWIPSFRLFPNRANLGHEQGMTPVYNADLLYNCSATHEDLSDLPPSLLDALILLKVWCLQRGFLGGHDSFRNVQDIALLLLYLQRTKHVTPRMAPLEILAAWFKFVSETEWLDNTNNNKSRVACVIPLEDLTETQTIQRCKHAQLYAQTSHESPINGKDPPTLLDCFKEYTDGPILLNSSMLCNLWGTMSPSFVKQLQHAATMSLDCLHNTITTRPFSHLFLQEARFLSSMDAIVKIPLKVFGKERPGNLCPFDGISRQVVQVLERALGDRVTLIRVLTTGNGRIETSDNPSQVPTYGANSEKHGKTIKSPTGDDHLVLGLALNPETCHRVVDRGPPAENVEATKEFVELWGSQKAQLRRFKDGAIVHAVVWNTVENDKSSCIQMEGNDKSQGGIVERVVRHILNLHFLQSTGGKQKHAGGIKPEFGLRDMLSLVDGVAMPSATPEDKLFTNATTAVKGALSAFGSLSEFLRQNSSPTIPVPGSPDAKTSRLGIPLAIDAVEPLSPTLRYSELFPPVPHPSLGGPRIAGNKVSGVAPNPILIQIRFGISSKWPTDLKAMGAAKTAMLIQLADGIESMKHSSGFEGPIQVTPSYMDVGYKGYSFRIIVRADPELNMLRKLQQPSPEAVSMLRNLRREHVVSATHHSMIHAIHTSYPSSSSVVRLAKRWVAAHLLSDLIPFEAIELMVAKVYTNRDVPLVPPTTLVSGFLRFLHLLSSHNWSRHPLVVDPHGHISEDEHSDIVAQFESIRGPDFTKGPPMYIVSPNDRIGEAEKEEAAKKTKTPCLWTPTFTLHNPELVVLSRAATLAKRSHDFLMNALSSNDTAVDWCAVFQETPSSFTSYSALLRVDSDFVVDKECSSTASELRIKRNESNGMLESSYTRSMRQRSLGPKALRRKVYRNLDNEDDDGILYYWQPVEELVQTLRAKFGSLAIFFYNDLSPQVIGMLWRPTSFIPHSFSAIQSEYAIPVEREQWKSDSLVMTNTSDVLREMSQYTRDIVANVKLLDDPTFKARPVANVSLGKRSARESSGDDDEFSSDSE